MVAVFPQDIEKSKEYLASAGIAVDDIKQARLIELGVKGTPTLVLVDKHGIATGGWVGTLSASQQAEISKAVGAKSLWDQ
jgi:thioredoxin-related protein